MNSADGKSPAISRSRVFIVGSLGTLLLSGLVLFCAPKKPAMVADSPAPQNAPVDLAGGVPQETPSPLGASLVRGGSSSEKLYARFCASCHGADGGANTTMARMMNPAPTNLRMGPWKGEQTVAAVINVIKNGKGAMPAFGQEISSEMELNGLAEYVLSLRRESAP